MGVFASGELVVLTKDRIDEGLVKGDLGTVVYLHEGGNALEVEFTTLAGDPLGVLTLKTEEVRHITVRDVPHVRVA